MASFHAIRRQNFFTTYEAADLGVVNIRNSQTSKIVGQDDMHVVRNIGYKLILKNVRHILDLKVSLLSTGVLDDSEFTSQFSHVWKLVKGSLVILGGRYDVLYIRISCS